MAEPVVRAHAALTASRKIGSVLWFPVLFAIALPVTFELAFHAPQPHGVPIAVVGAPSEVDQVRQDLVAESSGGFQVRAVPTRAAAVVAVRDRQVDAAYVDLLPSGPTLYVARAASAIRANYLQSVFTQVSARQGDSPPPLVDLVPLLSGDSGTGIFFFTFPMMMVGVITVIVLLQKVPTWPIFHRSLAVGAVGAMGAITAYLTATALVVLPRKPLLLLVGFVLSQIYGQLSVGAAPLLKQFFLPVAMTFALVVGAPASGATMMPDLLPTGLRYLSDVLPLAQAVKIAKDIAYFDGGQAGLPTLVLSVWVVGAVLLVGVAWNRQQGHGLASRPAGGDTAKRPMSVGSVDARS